ncbi:hypothetical protein [Levilactobacillus fujinensis]|uniref:Uncharacterized protein n=1 Tax=Levilactobacillus fujinensis TaxID=2486024 RepID=A0ABW1TEW6_9LACO
MTLAATTNLVALRWSELGRLVASAGSLATGCRSLSLEADLLG